MKRRAIQDEQIDLARTWGPGSLFIVCFVWLRISVIEIHDATS
jgi:hypothetical protein